MMRLINEMRQYWVAKVLSLLGAILLWLFVMKDENPVVVTSYTVPVQVQNLNANLLVDGVPDSITVRLRGPRNAVLDIEPLSLKAYIDLEQARIGQESLPIIFKPPTGVTVESMSQETALLSVDEYVTKELPVEAQNIGKLSDDIAIKSMTIVPKVVAVGGPKHLVSQVAHTIIRVSVLDRRDNFTSPGDVIAIDSEGRVVEGVTITPRQGQVQYELEKIRVEKKVKVSPYLVGTLPAGLVLKSVEVEPKEVTLMGKEQNVKGLDEVQTEEIPLAGINSSQEITVGVTIPEGVSTITRNVKIKLDIVR